MLVKYQSFAEESKFWSKNGNFSENYNFFIMKEKNLLKNEM